MTLKENYRPISLTNITDEYRCKNSEQNTSKMNPQYIKRIHCIPQLNGIHPGMQEWFNPQKSISVIYYIDRLKKKNHTIISINAEKNI